jgi:hypothetical protein
MPLSPELAKLAASQLGVVTRQQLLDGGLSPGQIRWALGSLADAPASRRPARARTSLGRPTTGGGALVRWARLLARRHDGSRCARATGLRGGPTHPGAGASSSHAALRCGRGAAAAGPPRRRGALGRGTQQPRPSTLPQGARGCGVGGVVTARGRPAEVDRGPGVAVSNHGPIPRSTTRRGDGSRRRISGSTTSHRRSWSTRGPSMPGCWTGRPPSERMRTCVPPGSRWSPSPGGHRERTRTGAGSHPRRLRTGVASPATARYRGRTTGPTMGGCQSGSRSGQMVVMTTETPLRRALRTAPGDHGCGAGTD